MPRGPAQVQGKLFQCSSTKNAYAPVIMNLYKHDIINLHVRCSIYV